MAISASVRREGSVTRETRRTSTGCRGTIVVVTFAYIEKEKKKKRRDKMSRCHSRNVTEEIVTFLQPGFLCHLIRPSV